MKDTKKALFEKYISRMEITKEYVVDYLLSNISDMIIVQRNIPLNYLALAQMCREANSIKIDSEQIKTKIDDTERD